MWGCKNINYLKGRRPPVKELVFRNSTLATDNEWAMVHKYTYDEVKNELPYKTTKEMRFELL